MSLELFGYKSVKEKVDHEKEWVTNNFSNCPVRYDPEAPWRENAVICRLSVLLPYCKHFGIYQILNQEFNDALADEIKAEGCTRVLEAGAGCGDLTAALVKRGINVLAIDDFSEPLPERCKNKAELVDQKDYREAIKHYKPDLVICSWMPEGEDWTPYIKETDSVKAFILIGEDSNKSDFNWQGEVLRKSNKWSLCRLDHGVDFEKPELWWRHSKVVIYRKH